MKVLERFPDSRQLALLASLLLPLLGCDAGPGQDLTEWSASLDQQAIDHPVHLPTHLPLYRDDGERPESYRLRRSVEIPAAWRGKPLTLSFVKLPALARLSVDGAQVERLDQGREGSYRADFPRRWRITAEQSGKASLDLELDLANTWAQSGWLDSVPRLSPTRDGGAGFRNINDWNRISSILGLAATVLAAIIFFGIFVANRKRDAGWFVLEVIGGGLYPAVNLNILQIPFGTFDVPLAGLGVSLAGLAGVHMVHALFKLGRPHRIWIIAWFAHVALAIVFHSPFHATTVAGFGGGGYIAVAAIYMMVRYAMVWRRERHRTALTLAVGWLTLAVLAGPDILSWIGLGGIFAGWQGAGAGIFMIAVTQAINLSREHAAALAAADALATKLSEQVNALKQSNEEKQRLNEELRHQVGLRSKQLADSLARTPAGGVPALKIGVGDVINDRYRIESIIGSGGMGVVYRAVRLSDERPCALKVIKHRASGEYLARLSREAMVLSQIQHPNVIEILDINVSQSGRLYIVMELVEGTSLDTKTERYGDVAWALPIVGQLASALEAIHARNVIHRDLKPPNILLLETDGPHEQVKVADFGLAGIVEGGQSAVLQLATTVDVMSTTKPPKGLSLTQTGAILGTPLYMAPEFVSGTKEIGPPADVFSFGVIAYEVFTGTRPFEKLPIIAAVHGDKIVPQRPLAEACPGLAPEIAALITRCLDPDQGRRPPAQEIVSAIKT